MTSLRLQGGDKFLAFGRIPCGQPVVNRLVPRAHLEDFLLVPAGAQAWPGERPKDAITSVSLRTVDSEKLAVVEALQADFHLKDGKVAYVICRTPDDIPTDRSRLILDRIAERLREGGVSEESTV